MVEKIKLKIKNKRLETKDCVSLSFDIPAEYTERFNYNPGQYLTLCADYLGAEIRRSYSICSAPHESELRVAIKRVEDGIFSSKIIDTLHPGDIIEVLTPEGRFTTEINSNQSKQYLFIAAGSGITPILSLIKSILHEESNSNVNLLYGNQYQEDIIFKEELLALKNIYLQRLSIHFILSKEFTEEENFYGRIDANKIKLFHNILYDLHQIDHVFICGPEAMIIEINHTLHEMSVPHSKIHVELFGTAPSTPKKPSPKKEDLGKTAQVSLKLNGRTVQFGMAYNEESILDAALQNKLPLPYACKGGVCCTCKAKLIEGKVEMMVNYGLEPEEIAANYILTCQAFPITEKVIVDYD